MNEKYAPAELESAAQAHWARPLWQGHDAYRIAENALDSQGRPKPKFYACSMLPYPSGKLHMGHVRNYTINDMLARQLRMQGFNVLMPMGWDAFGLPAENAAMKNKVPPGPWTYSNIAQMKAQMQAMGLAIDWSRELTTCKPAYYRWNQWLFLKMLEKGIAQRRTQVVNWDPVDLTVLANEQVIDGRGWRSGALVEKREIPGYYLKITDYAEELLSAVNNPLDPHYLAGWPDRVRLMQENWIGKSEGVRFAFTHHIADGNGKPIGDGRMWVFTTRADTIMGVTFCAVAPEHALAAHAAAANPAVAAFIAECAAGGTTEAELATQEKKGVATGLTVTHPLTGQAVAVWVGNYVLMSYGDGAVMGVPAHDQRDFEFAKKYGLAIQQVVAVDGETFSTEAWADSYADKQRGRCVNSDVLDGLACKPAVAKVAELLAAKGLGERKTTWRLRDWGVSRQRFWGTPIPIIHCDAHGAVPVPEADLPVVLPEDCIPDGSGNPLNKRADFLNVACPVCGAPSRRETDTMDTFVDSSWYFMRYCDPGNSDKMVAEGSDYWLPMDQYIGGVEHAILHLLYARFWTKVMRDLGLVKISEPFTKLLTQGMVLKEAFVRQTDAGGREYFWEHDLDLVRDEHAKVVSATAKRDGLPVACEGWTTMSKSKNNGVDPQALIDSHGADTARLFVMFASPPEQTLEWNDAGVEGAHRFLKRVWAFGTQYEGTLSAPVLHSQNVTSSIPEVKAFRREIHLTLLQATQDYDRMQYNTVVSACMKLLNSAERFNGSADSFPGAISAISEAYGILLRVLYPACPHIAHALWQRLGYAKKLGDILDTPWPAVDHAALRQDQIELVLQISGKHRGAISVPAGADRATIEAAALAAPEFARFSGGQPVKKVIVVPGRLVNLVL